MEPGPCVISISWSSPFVFILYCLYIYVLLLKRYKQYRSLNNKIHRFLHTTSLFYSLFNYWSVCLPQKTVTSLICIHQSFLSVCTYICVYMKSFVHTLNRMNRIILYLFFDNLLFLLNNVKDLPGVMQKYLPHSSVTV